ncbi:MAG: ImmA/IrrE family metallo-endopeptidase [Bacteroidales bacterium]
MTWSPAHPARPLACLLGGAVLAIALVGAVPTRASSQQDLRAAPALPPPPPRAPKVSAWLERLRVAAAASERRDVIVALVSERGVADMPDKARTVLRNNAVRRRVFAPGTMGYTFIPPRPQPIVVFVNTDRVEPSLVDLIAAHELGHVLLHSRGFLQVVMFPGDPREPLLIDAFNAVQDVLLERELARHGVDTKPLLLRQLRTIGRALSMAGPDAIVPDSGSLQTSHLATMVTPLMMTVPDGDPAKARLRELLPRDVIRLVNKYSKILSGPVATVASYREAIYEACEANGLNRREVEFAPD